MTARWFSQAVRESGHPEAHGYENIAEPRHKIGLVYHSAEGSLATLRRIIAAPGEPSFTFINPKVGRLIQCYPRGTNIWANGSLDANILFDACESEGMAGEPLTDSQVKNLIDLARWYVWAEEWEGFARWKQAWEHRDMTRFGAPPTACPSHRIPWDIIIPAVEEDMVSQEDFAAFVAQMKVEQEFQNKALIDMQGAIDYLAKIAVDHEKRLKALETHSHDRHGSGPLFGYPVE